MKIILIVSFLTVGFLTAFQVAAIHGHPDTVEEEVTLSPGLSIVWDQTYGNQIMWRMDNGDELNIEDAALYGKGSKPDKKMAEARMKIEVHWQGAKGDKIGAASDYLALVHLLNQGRPQLEWGRPETTDEDVFIMPNPFHPAAPKGVIGTISFDMRTVQQGMPSLFVSMYAAAIKVLYEIPERDDTPSRKHRASAEREQFDVEFFRFASLYLKMRGNDASKQEVDAWKKSYQLAHLTPQHAFTNKDGNRVARNSTVLSHLL